MIKGIYKKMIYSIFLLKTSNYSENLIKKTFNSFKTYGLFCTLNIIDIFQHINIFLI